MSLVNDESEPTRAEVKLLLYHLDQEWSFLKELGYTRSVVKKEPIGGYAVEYKCLQRDRGLRAYFGIRKDMKVRTLVLGVDVWKVNIIDSNNMMISTDNFLKRNNRAKDIDRLLRLSWQKQLAFYTTLLKEDLCSVIQGESWLQGYQSEPGHE